MPVAMTPRFTHDCRKCKFEGRFGLYDVYTCPSLNRDSESLLARKGNAPEDYSSSLRSVFVRMVCDHLEGRVLALDKSGPDPRLPGWAVAILGTIYNEDDSVMFGTAWDMTMLVREKYIACECALKKEKCEWCKKAAALDIK